MDPTYKLIAHFSGGAVQEHLGLTTKAAERAVDAFLDDLFILKGQGVVRLIVEIERGR
jgi:hypothetical protein